MESSINTGLILLTLLHLGMAISIWGPKGEQGIIINSIFDALEYVSLSAESPNVNEEIEQSAMTIPLLINRIQGIEADSLDAQHLRHVGLLVERIAVKSNDSQLYRANKEFLRCNELYVRFDSSNGVLSILGSMLELDNDQSFGHSKIMSNFFKKYAKTLQSLDNSTDSLIKKEAYSQDEFEAPASFLEALYKYNLRKEWISFMMMTTAYKLQSVLSSNYLFKAFKTMLSILPWMSSAPRHRAVSKYRRYVMRFQRLSRELMNKSEMHRTKFYKAQNLLQQSRKFVK